MSPRAVIAAVALLAPGAAHAARVDIDLVKSYGAVSHDAIAQGIAEARRRFAQSPDDVVVLHVPAGVFAISSGDGKAAIDVSRVHPSVRGRLVVQGAGKAATTLVFDSKADEIGGRETYHVSFVGMRFTIGHMTVSQGRVEAIEAGAVVVRIEDGFPTPGDLFEPLSDRGRYVRRCDASGPEPHIIDDAGNVQVAWQRAEPVSGRDWRMELGASRGAAPFRVGDVLAIKSKKIEGGAYRFLGGSDIVFDDVAWSRVTRGVFRGTDDVQILNSAILREPAVGGHVPCLASAGGGPQMGQPRDPPVTGMVVENFTASGTGDDALAFFNASGAIRNVTIRDSFARGILLYHSPDVEMSGIEVERAPVLKD